MSEPEVGQWRINTQRHRKRQEPFQLIKPSGNLQWLARYESGRNFHLGRGYVETSTEPIIVCHCEKRPTADGDYVCWACRIQINARQ